MYSFCNQVKPNIVFQKINVIIQCQPTLSLKSDIAGKFHEKKTGMTTRLQELWSSAFSDFVGKTPQPTFMPGFFLKTIF